MWRNTWRKNWVNCAVLTSNSTGHRTVLFSRLSHRELYNSLREFHSSLSLPADTTVASSQATSVSSYSFSRWASHDIFLFKYHLFLHFYAFVSSFRIKLWPMWLENGKWQPCFYPPWSHEQEGHTEQTKKKQTWSETCAVPENIQFSFSCRVLHS